MAIEPGEPKKSVPRSSVPLGPALTAEELAEEMGDGSRQEDLEAAKKRFRKQAPSKFKTLLDAKDDT